MVDQLAEIFTVIDPRMLWVDAEVFEGQLPDLSVGQSATITLPFDDGPVLTDEELERAVHGSRPDLRVGGPHLLVQVFAGDVALADRKVSSIASR